MAKLRAGPKFSESKSHSIIKSGPSAVKHFVQEELAGGETEEGRWVRKDWNDSATPGTRVTPTEGTERVQEECANEKQQVVRPG